MRRAFMNLIAAAMLFAPTGAIAQNTSNPASPDLVRVIRVDPVGGNTQGAVGVVRLFNGVGVGYGSGSGAGSTATQLTSRATAISINTFSGRITMFAAAGSATAASFTVTNTKVVATDTVNVSVASATNSYLVFVTAVAAGSFQISYYTTGGVASDSPVINFAVVHAATS